MSDLDVVRQALEGHYAIGEELGAGGMAIVYRAHDLKHDRDVALKIFRPELRTALGAERFLQEIHLTGSLQHPHIVPLFDSGDRNGVLYYATSLVEGRTLRERLEQGDLLPVSTVVAITQVLAEALQFAHDHRVIHRDIKPENVLFQGDSPVLADFGVALALDVAGEDRLTQTGVAVGTVHYMSPEQASGEHDLDGRSDQYGLACMVYEMLAGAPPFTGPTLQSIVAKRFLEPAPRVSMSRQGVSATLEAVLARALECSPADRFPSVADFGEALKAASQEGTAVEGRTSRPAKSIAVLPFVNRSASPDDEYFTDGITEDLIHALGYIEGLRVVARTSVFAFKGRNEDIRTIGRQLDVGSLLEGSVRRAGNRIRVNVQLVSTLNGFEFWSERYERDMEDVFQVQDDLVRSIVGTLQGQVFADDEPALTPWTDDLGAYDLYLKGRHEWNKRTETSLAESAVLLDRAVRADPSFAVAWTALADTLLTIAIYGGAPPAEVIPRAREATAEALRHQPGLPEALTARGCLRALFDWQWHEAERDFQAAIGADREYPLSRQWYAMNCLVPQRRFDEARRHLVKATRVDPLSPVFRISAAVIRYFEDQAEQAVTALAQVSEAHPKLAVPHYFAGMALERLGHFDRAVTELEIGAAMSDAPEIAGALAYVHARAGQEARAHRGLEALLQLRDRRFVSPTIIAQVYVGLGDLDAATEWLRNAVEIRAADLVWLAVRPTFQPLWQAGLADEILAGMGLDAAPRTRAS